MLYDHKKEIKDDNMEWFAPAYLVAQIVLHAGFLVFWTYAKYYL